MCEVLGIARIHPEHEAITQVSSLLLWVFAFRFLLFDSCFLILALTKRHNAPQNTQTRAEETSERVLKGSEGTRLRACMFLCIQSLLRFRAESSRAPASSPNNQGRRAGRQRATTARTMKAQLATNQLLWLPRMLSSSGCRCGRTSVYAIMCSKPLTAQGAGSLPFASCPRTRRLYGDMLSRHRLVAP